jgi:hypothetical protein
MFYIDLMTGFKRRRENYTFSVDKNLDSCTLQDGGLNLILKNSWHQVMNDKGPQPMKREWFQSRKRGADDGSKAQSRSDKTPGGKKFKKDILAGTRKKSLEDIHPMNWRHKKKFLEREREQKNIKMHARFAKKAGKPQRTRALDEKSEARGRPKDAGGLKKKSSFDKDLTNVSRKSVKKFRHE